MSQRYNRQSLIKGWDQSKLSAASIAVIGEGRLADYLVLDMLSFGFGKVKRIGKHSTPNFEFDKINPCVEFEHCPRLPVYAADAIKLAEGSQCIIDCTNSEKIKSFSSTAASKNHALYCSASASERDLRFMFGAIAKLESLVSPIQGEMPSMLGSALIAEELRKRFIPLEDDISQDNFEYSFADVQKRNLKALQIGAGAIGTFSALAFSSMGLRLSIIDRDFVEESNLNRQCLFYDCVGKNKAESLAQKLNNFGYSVSGKREEVTQDFNPAGFDILISAVDNMAARSFINKASLKYNIPVIDGGSSVNHCNTFALVPEKTACLDCQYFGKISEKSAEVPASRGGNCFHPSIITSNQIAAALMADTYQKMLSGDYQCSRYLSGVGIFSESISPQCEDSCAERNYKNETR